MDIDAIMNIITDYCDKYNINYHKKVFNRMCNLLNGYVNKIVISFIDDYKNVRNKITIENA